MKGLNKITCCLLAALLMPCAGHAENEQYGANFNNADIRQFVEIVGQHLGKTILIDPSVQGTISVRSNDTFSQQEYYQFFLSILDLYGYSVITLDNGFLKVVRSANVKTSPGMIADSSRPGVGDELVTRIVPLENVPARDLAPLLRQMMDAGSVGNVVHYEPSNVLILTGRASTINKLIEVIKRVDVIGTEKQQIIHLEVSSVDSSSNSTLGPTFNTRTIQNAVLVKTGETVVLGGLLDDFSKEQVSKVPLLGDIPLVGQLFRYTSTERAKRNLMVFIRPTIIRDDDVYRSLSKEKYTRYRQEQQQRIDGKSKALVGSEDLPVLDENTFNSHAPAPSSR
ncbi:secretin N-terminal domain-containing protein [Escherichia coli]|uniref:secretin N-terminal domain-containing protein n=1 Tax=Escherichia coli TaxID=562 RepID=UPI0001A5C01A|nr:secretin N-terminal domain-containing protein [Escherichia coli]AMR24838.1 general secretion pathway protein [Shigella sp. PAMC 28760]HBD4499167.1 hypothetical protein [Shigella flexneri]ACT27497.1 type II and III secretion system protein [Escherichia coli 'BL21-Gold(DE3)pLysS AG']ACT44980.1 general secretory pathway component, cryptic [Escherichia coli BL21(DE3)]AJF78430.1 general secretion pathway protein [Escherichia coli]